MASDRETAERIVMECSNGDSDAAADAIEAALSQARTDERRKAGGAWAMRNEEHAAGCEHLTSIATDRYSICTCGLRQRKIKATAYLDTLAAEAKKETT